MAGPRRSPGRDDRLRHAERSRAALLDAARVEFADKGFAGARVEAIAARAGLNKQLISYYFGGKQGLYDTIIERWYAKEREFNAVGATLVQLVLHYLESGHHNPHLQRMFPREALDQDPADVERDQDSDGLTGLCGRQRAGELAADLDPGFVLLFLQAVVVAGSLFPVDAMRLTGLDPTSSQFYERAREQLGRVVEHLA